MTPSALAVDITCERRSVSGERFRLEARLEAGPGVTVVCGPSGAGKTSLLHCVLGALTPSAGRIELGGRTLFDAAVGLDVPVRRRRVGMVFQDGLLFPHLDARANVAFGIPGRDSTKLAERLLHTVGASALARRRPAELSRGETQRVALARALGASPEALLLDEPFSALDVAARGELGRLLLELQASRQIPFVLVTHDPSEALRLGTYLALLDSGRVVQTGSPSEVLARPASVAAARTVGTENLYAGTVIREMPEEGLNEVDIGGTRVCTLLLRAPSGERITLGLRAEDVLICLRELSDTSARNVLPGTVESIDARGPAVEVRVATPAPVRALVTPISVRELGLEPGRRVFLLIKASAFHRVQ